jgi:hypothetical protein
LNGFEFFKKKLPNFKGCLDKIENWYREHYIMLLYSGLLLSTIEFFLLLSIVLNCSKLKHKKLRHHITPSPVNFLNEVQSNILRRRNMAENIYQGDFISVAPPTTSTGISSMREIYIQPMELPMERARRNNYKMNGKSYLV